MKRISFLVLLFGFHFKVSAQVISKEVLNKFPPGVISRVYDIAKTTKLSDNQQMALAEQYQNAEDLLVKNLNEGKSQREIDSAQRFAEIKTVMLLGKDMLAYTAAKAEAFARAASGGETKYVQQEYKLDTSLATKIKNLQFNKYKRVYQQFLLYGADQAMAQEKITETVRHYDSLSFVIYPTLHSGKYLETYLADVKKIKPLIADTTIRRIQDAFFIATTKNPYIDCGQTMLDIMQHIYPDTAITAHFYRPAIERQAKFLSSAGKSYLINEQHVSKAAFDSIYSLVWQKNYQQVLIEYTVGANSKFRDSVINISNKHFDSSINAALLRDGSMLAANQFAIALKYKTVLQLRPSLIDTLLWHAMYLTNKFDSIRAKEPFAKTDFKSYEAKWLNTLLTEDQYTKLLSIKNNSTAQLDAEDDWEDMKTWNITSGFEKEATIKELFRYYMAKWIVYYRLANDKLKQEANLRSLKDAQPKALKMLSAAKKLPNPVNDNTTLQIKW